MWSGLRLITEYEWKTSSAEIMSTSLPDKLKTFHALFGRRQMTQENINTRD